MNKFKFELVSPEARVMSEEVTMVTIPGTEGDIGVLAGHAPLITSMRPGVIAIYRNGMDDAPVRLFVTGGFADINLTACTVLAEKTVPVAEISGEAAAQELADLQARFNSTQGVEEREKIAKQMVVAQAKRSAA